MTEKDRLIEAAVFSVFATGPEKPKLYDFGLSGLSVSQAMHRIYDTGVDLHQSENWEIVPIFCG